MFDGVAIRVLVGLAAAPACSSATPTRTTPTVRADFSPVNKLIQAQLDRGVTSLAVSVVKDGAIVWEDGFGWEDRDARRPATAHSRYPIASTTKPFVATAVMILVERGRVDLSAPVNRYLAAGLTRPDGDPDAATVRHLLQHRAGLPSPHVTRYYVGEDRTPPPINETIRRYGFLVEPPDRRHAYSNLGFGILAHVTAVVAGVSFETFLEREILQPLGMADTTLEDELVLSRPAVTLYEDGKVVPYFIFDEVGSGRVYSSVHDLARFALFHLGDPLSDQRRILRDDARRRMVDDNRPTAEPGGFWGPDWFYGLGWGGRQRTEHNARLWYGHDGGVPGARSDLRLVPDEDLAVAVLTNDGRADVTEIVNAVIDVMVPEHARVRRTDPTAGPRAPAAAFRAPAELVGAWAGEIRTWNGSVPVRLVIAVDGARIAIGGGADVTLADLALDRGRITGTSPGRLPAPDVAALPHALRYELRRDGDRLVGACWAADTMPMRQFVLPSWIELRSVAR